MSRRFVTVTRVERYEIVTSSWIHPDSVILQAIDKDLEVFFPGPNAEKQVEDWLSNRSGVNYPGLKAGACS